MTAVRSLAGLLALCASASAVVQDAPDAPPMREVQRREVPRRTVGRLPMGVAAPRIDADLDDEAWRHAVELGEFTQTTPIAGAPPSEASRIRVLCDSRTLYFALECFDREPHLLRATQMQRDANLDPDERVEILIDSFFDRRNAFWFQIGAAGSLGDALITRNGSTFNKQWDGIWNGRAKIDASGWRAELAIPFATINFDPNATTWGLNLRRFIRRRNEEVRWASADPRISFFWVAGSGELTGFAGLQQGLGLDVAPFAVARATRDRIADRSDEELDVGVDAYYRLSPSDKLSVSINTDFAETEVDQRQVNLTRFPLFFPEQRDFFLEDSGVFQFGVSGQLLPFFSRRIGLDGSGRKVPITAAAKLTGQTGPWTYGLLDVQTESTAALDSQNLFAGRISRHLLAQSDFGLIWTQGDPRGVGDATTVGADLNLLTDEFLGSDTLRLSSFVAATENEGAGDVDLAWQTRLAYPNDQIEWSLATGAVDEGFDPRLGFVDRTGVRRHDASYTYRPRINREVRQLEFAADAQWVEDIGDGTQTFRAALQPIGVILDTGDSARLEFAASREVLDAPFDIHPDATIDAGDYRFDRVNFSLETSDHRELSVIAAASAGDFFDGESEDFELALDWRQSAYFLATASYEHTDARLPGGDFSVNVGRLKVTALFSPRVSWSNNFQWDDVSDDLGLNSRLWWIFAPGVQAFVVLNQGWRRAGESFEPTTSEWAVKFGYTLRF